MDIADHLKNRMEIIAEIVGSVRGRGDPFVWRWDDFKRDEGIKVESFKDAGAQVLWQRKGRRRLRDASWRQTSRRTAR